MPGRAERLDRGAPGASQLSDARAAAETAARASYGRLLAFVAARTRDVAAAEDALAEAFAAALTRWPATGVPDNPEAWLLTAARRRLANLWRHDAVIAAAEPALRLAADEAEAHLPDFPDERLKLLFVCAHPAIDAGVRTPLMLQTVLGLDAARIAAAYREAPATVGQRLVRAKAKLKLARIRFAVPDADALPERLTAVLDAIYAAYTLDWGDGGPLAHEALFLARLVATLLRGESEAQGLAALLLFSASREAARRDGGRFVPLGEQDCTRWNGAMVAEAEAHLLAAVTAVPGRYGLEAAIQSAHAWRARSGTTPWRAVLGLYDRLVAVVPTVGAAVARAATLAEVEGPAAALAALDAIEGADFQPWWAVRADLLARIGADAGPAYARAITLTRDPAVAAYLRNRAGGAGLGQRETKMTAIHYKIVEHDGGWTYKLGDVFADTFRTHDEAMAAARIVAQEQQLGGETVPISWQDADGQWHEETAQGDDRPIADVSDG